MTTTEAHQDPRSQHPEPPFPKQQQEPPGVEADLVPLADHGEETYRGAGRLDVLVALITGADSGIGKAVAIAFAREGADVAISYLGGVEDEDAADTARWVEKAGRRAITVDGDIRDDGFCRSLVERTADELGHLDILVNNAAWQDPSTMPAEHAAKFGENTPLGRAGQPAELAPLFVFLASQESSYITGEVIGITGGRPLG